MKKYMLVIALSGLVFLNACLVCSLQPFYSEKDPVFSEDLLGKWVTGEGEMGFIFNKTEETNYLVEVAEDKENSMMCVHLFKLKDQFFLDYYPDSTMINTFLDVHHVPVHTLMKLEFTADNFTYSFLDEDWLRESLTSGMIKNIRYEDTEDRIILTSPTPELQVFIEQHMNTPGAFTDSVTLYRKAQPTGDTTSGKTTTGSVTVGE